MGQVTLYHFSAVENVNSILEHGIRPRGRKKPSFEVGGGDFPSNPRMVYAARLKSFGQHMGREGRYATFRVTVDTDNLYPDEDYIEWLEGKEHRPFSSKQLWAMQEANKELWKDSLKGWGKHDSGSVAHLGPIAANQVELLDKTLQKEAAAKLVQAAELLLGQAVSKKDLTLIKKHVPAKYADAVVRLIDSSGFHGSVYALQFGNVLKISRALTLTEAKTLITKLRELANSSWMPKVVDVGYSKPVFWQVIES